MMVTLFTIDLGKPNKDYHFKGYLKSSISKIDVGFEDQYRFAMVMYIANAGDSRAVLAREKKKFIGALKVVRISEEHNASFEFVREELRSLHPNDPNVESVKARCVACEGSYPAAVVVSRSGGGGGCRQRWQIEVVGSRSKEIRARLKTKGADRSCGEQIGVVGSRSMVRQGGSRGRATVVRQEDE
ncbi:hypothetical protein L1987_13177 [Smallanthus sonchifolius]|uniref:Uncharacterized protein n=1 Tax=Smallanthus sonchifolius TaxID=185202 RepID=A0ACB9JI57_9ASTR|nr:hypothetical protein L1987_13177 [Smallanthus sonchifolius]